MVLTFDDGPLPKYSYQVLQILASQCVKATFFLVGSQAKANPEGVRKIRNAGHTIATHTQNHPSNMHLLGIERAKQEIDDGIASVTAALADGSAPVPFFRIPGLARNGPIEDYAASRGLQVWSADFPADDWRPVSAARVYDLAIQRLEAHRKGILLLHDIQARTVAALPRILNELKVRGYRVVHVVPATPDLPATPTEPSQWIRRPGTEAIATTRWPRIPRFVFTQSAVLPGPGLANLDWRDPSLLAPARHRAGLALEETPWPEFRLSQAIAPSSLPAPAASVFRVPEAMRLTMLAGGARANRLQHASSRPRQTAGVVQARPGTTAIPPAHAGRAPAARPRHPATQGVHGAPIACDPDPAQPETARPARGRSTASMGSSYFL